MAIIWYEDAFRELPYIQLLQRKEVITRFKEG